MAYEQPGYEVTAEYETFEVRQYAPVLVAETEVEGSFEDSGNVAFRILAGFIFGDNRSDEKIAMTAPVTNRVAEPAGEKIEMTAPVVQERSAGEDTGRWTYRFIMPSRFSPETLPEPTDPRVRIRSVPGRRVAARRFSGFWRGSRFEAQAETLRAAVEAAGLESTGAPIYARYNAPFMPWFLRRNEVWLELR